MRVIAKYVSAPGKEFATAAEARAHEDRLPALIFEWRADLGALRRGTFRSIIPLSREEQVRMVPSWEARVAEFEAMWAEVQAQRAEVARDPVSATLRSEYSTEDLVAEVCRRMALGAPVPPSSTSWPLSEGSHPGERTTATEAAEHARRILAAAERTGLGGCPLCRT